MTQPLATLGRLFLVPTPLDFMCQTQAPIHHVLPDHTLHTAANISHWVCENAKSARAFLKRVNETHPLAVPLASQHMVALPHEVHKKGDQAATAEIGQLLQPALQGHDIGLLSEAGMPAIADPGASVVRAAHALGVRVVPLVGPSSLLLALAASGLNGQSFAFVGYLPQDAVARRERIQALGKQALASGQTQLLIETPYRNSAVFTALVQALPANLQLCVASHLSLPTMQVISRRVSAWKNHPLETDKHTPMVFAFGP